MVNGHWLVNRTVQVAMVVVRSMLCSRLPVSTVQQNRGTCGIAVPKSTVNFTVLVP